MRSSLSSASASSLLLLLLLLLAAPAAASGRRPPEFRISVDPSVVTAGRTLVVRLSAPARLRRARMVAGGRATELYQVSTGTWRAFWGVGSQEPAGLKEARLEAAWGRKILSSTFSFTVQDGDYPVSRIPLTKAMNSLITSGQLARDTKVLSAAASSTTVTDRLWEDRFVMPTTGIVTSVFGARRAYGDRPPGPGHSGVDIANEEGTLLVAPARSRVAFAGWLESLGNAVVLEHGQGVFSYFLHMKESLVRPGQVLVPGEPVGLMGKEGLATGPHLHWTLVVSGERVDALEWTEKAFE